MLIDNSLPPCIETILKAAQNSPPWPRLSDLEIVALQSWLNALPAHVRHLAGLLRGGSYRTAVEEAQLAFMGQKDREILRAVNATVDCLAWERAMRELEATKANTTASKRSGHRALGSEVAPNLSNLPAEHPWYVCTPLSLASAKLLATLASPPAPTVKGSTKKTKGKQSTERGKTREILIGVLVLHHKYEDGGCLNLEPIGNNEAARQAGVRPSTAVKFFKKEFGSYEMYKKCCQSPGELVAALKLLRGEYSPRHLLGKADNLARPDDNDPDSDATGG